LSERDRGEGVSLPKSPFPSGIDVRTVQKREGSRKKKPHNIVAWDSLSSKGYVPFCLRRRSLKGEGGTR